MIVHVHSSDLRTLREIGLSPDHFDAINRQLYGVFHNDKNAKSIEKLLRFLLCGSEPDLSEIVANGVERKYLTNLVRLKSRLVFSGNILRLAKFEVPEEVGEDFDCLLYEDPDWSLLRTINYLFLSRINPTKKLAVLTSIRNEGINIIEWVAYYRTLGVDSIFVYKNENDDASDGLLELLARNSTIQLIENKTSISGVFKIQQKVFGHALQFLEALWDHEWMLFIDPDEYLLLDERSVGSSVTGLVARFENTLEGSSASGMCVNWKWFPGNGELHRASGLLFDRYNTSRQHAMVKTLSRLRDVTGIRTAHLPRLINGGFLVDSAFRRLVNPMNEVGPVYGLAQINHYWNKSFEEFLCKRIRGKGDREYRDFFMMKDSSSEFVEIVPMNLIAALRAEVLELQKIPGLLKQIQIVEDHFRNTVANFRDEEGRNSRELYQHLVASNRQ